MWILIDGCEFIVVRGTSCNVSYLIKLLFIPTCTSNWGFTGIPQMNVLTTNTMLYALCNESVCFIVNKIFINGVNMRRTSLWLNAIKNIGQGETLHTFIANMLQFAKHWGHNTENWILQRLMSSKQNGVIQNRATILLTTYVKCI